MFMIPDPQLKSAQDVQSFTERDKQSNGESVSEIGYYLQDH